MIDVRPVASGLNDDDVHVIASLEALRLLAHPLRLRILEALRGGAGEAKTVKQLATELDVPQTKLYYHVNLLAGQGIIRVAGTRTVSGIVEKRYRVSAYRLTVDKALLAPGAGDDVAALDVLLSVVLDEARSEIKRSVRAGLIDLDRFHEDRLGPDRLVLGRKWLRLTPAQLEEFSSRFDDLTRAFAPEEREPGPRLTEDPGATATDARLYEFLIGFYPTVPPEAPDTHESNTS